MRSSASRSATPAASAPFLKQYSSTACLACSGSCCCLRRATVIVSVTLGGCRFYPVSVAAGLLVLSVTTAETVKRNAMRRMRAKAIGIPVGWIVAVAGTLAACTPQRHTVEPYRSDPGQAAQLERRARDVCDGMAHPEGLPPAPFVTDGCSAWPDAGWMACCVEHDIAYWCGGSESERRAADEALRQCVASRSSAAMGRSMWVGTRLGGHPTVPMPWRWGFGRDWPAGYTPD